MQGHADSHRTASSELQRRRRYGGENSQWYLWWVEVKVDLEAASRQGGNQGCCGLCLADPGDVKGDQLVDCSQNSDGNVKALQL